MDNDNLEWLRNLFFRFPEHAQHVRALATADELQQLRAERDKRVECPECNGEMMTEVYPDETEETKCPYCELQKSQMKGREQTARIAALEASVETWAKHADASATKAREATAALEARDRLIAELVAAHDNKRLCRYCENYNDNHVEGCIIVRAAAMQKGGKS